MIAFKTNRARILISKYWIKNNFVFIKNVIRLPCIMYFAFCIKILLYSNTIFIKEEYRNFQQVINQLYLNKYAVEKV